MLPKRPTARIGALMLLGLLLAGSSVRCSPPPTRRMQQFGGSSTPFNLISARVDSNTQDLWMSIQDELFDALANEDGGPCGDQARVWWRIFFHDFATFDRARGTGGLDGSVQFELDRPDNAPESGIPESIDLYRSIINQHSSSGAPVSMADMVTLAAKVAVAACEGPQMSFTAGRKDARGPNADGMLPNALDGFPTLMNHFKRMGLAEANLTAMMAAGHTIARVAKVDSLDSTDSRFDNVYCQEIIERSHPFIIQADAALMDNSNSIFSWMQRFAGDEALFFKVVSDTCEWMSWQSGANGRPRNPPKKPVIPKRQPPKKAPKKPVSPPKSRPGDYYDVQATPNVPVTPKKPTPPKRQPPKKAPTKPTPDVPYIPYK